MDILKDKTVVITGVNSGIGRECARMFAAEGAKIVGADVRTDRMDELEASVKEAGSEFLGCQCDVRSGENVKDVLHQAFERFGHIDITILCGVIFLGSLVAVGGGKKMRKQYPNELETTNA